jgi:hypothetical protein
LGRGGFAFNLGLRGAADKVGLVGAGIPCALLTLFDFSLIMIAFEEEFLLA